MLTAKQHFLSLRLRLSSSPETNEFEINQKMLIIQEVDIKFAIWWTIFWFLLGFILFTFALVINYINYSTRKKWRQSEYDRLWYKLNNLNMNNSSIFNNSTNDNNNKI